MNTCGAYTGRSICRCRFTTLFGFLLGTTFVLISSAARCQLAAPTIVTATVASSTSVTVDWVVVSGASGYTVSYGTTSSATGNTSTTGGKPRTISGLTSGTTYYFMVKATGSGNSYSSVVSATPGVAQLAQPYPQACRAGDGQVTNYTIDPDSGFGDTIEDRSGSGTLEARYDYGDDLIDMQRSAGTSFYLFDGHGSTMQLANGSGTVTDSYQYDAYGDLLSHSGSTPNVYLYDAQCQDGTGLYYLRARYMEPSSGEFLGQDPFGGDNEDPVSLHRYLFAGDDPSDMEDPGGLDATQQSLMGIEVHLIIGSGFVLSDPENRTSNLAIKTLLGGEESVVPDLIDNRLGLVWEIKPDNVASIQLGMAQLDSYLVLAQHASPRYPPWWYGGSQYIYDTALGPIVPLPGFNAIAVVFPPVQGIITYATIDLGNPLAQLELSYAKEVAQEEQALALAGADAAIETVGAARDIWTGFPSLQIQPNINSIAVEGSLLILALAVDRASIPLETATATLTAL